MVVALLVVALIAFPAGAAPGADAPVDKVLILSVPALDWQLVHDEQPPALTELFGRSAVASLSVRTVDEDTSAAEAYATVGAGTRATASSEGGLVAPGQVSPPVVAAVAEIRAANLILGYGARPGALGQSLAASGHRRAVVANADVVGPSGRLQPSRAAVLALMDDQGRIGAGRVGPELTVADPTVPGGLRTRIDATVIAFEAAWEDAEVVLVEAADLARVDAVARAAGLPADARPQALARVDALVGDVLERIDLGRHLVVVVAPVSGRAGDDGLTVAALAGPGVAPGVATSASTSRTGYVTLPDVAPTVLDALARPVPSSMVGTPIIGGDGTSPGPSTFEELAAADTAATFRDRAIGPASVVFVVFQLLAYALAVAALARWPRLAPLVVLMALVTLALPPLAFLSGLVRYDRLGLVGYLSVLVAGAGVLAAGALALSRALAPRTGPLRPLVAPLALVALTVAVLVGDIVTGGRLQLNTVFGYSPIVAGRFTGFGNLAFALVSMAALVLVTGVWALAARTQGASAPQPRRRWLAAVGVGLAVVVVADGHPALGADVGGVLAFVPAVLVVLVVLAGRRVHLPQVAGIAAATAAVAAAFAAVDLARPATERTHLGRFAARVLDGGDGVGTIIGRKIDANVSLLGSSVWAMLIPVALGVVALAAWRRRHHLRRLEAEVPGLRACLVAAGILAVLGGALNDSGVAVPAMMLAVILPYVTVLAVTLGGAPVVEGDIDGPSDAPSGSPEPVR